MHEPQSLREAYTLVQNLIPDYEWTTLFDRATNDLQHIPTHIILSYDVEGYYLTQTDDHRDMWDYEQDDYCSTTHDPMVAAVAFVMHVIKETIQSRIATSSKGKER